ncbi:hypothetical protein H0W26_00970 [Candidatus Dependentiae bacterium]|nr:hypothetical protein [Candidatus Dependentiae bacterium]
MNEQLYCSSVYTLGVIWLLITPHTLYAEDIWALVRVPSTDLSLGRLSRSSSFPNAYYNEFPCAPDKGLGVSFRFHQLKFNELVKVRTHVGPEVECEFQHFFYRGHDKKQYNRAWVLKRDLVFLKDLPSKDLLSHIPPLYKMNDHVSRYNKNVLTLTVPWLDRTTVNTYSAGTRFMRSPSKDTKTSYGIFVIEGTSLKSSVKFVPRVSALVSYPQNSSQAAALFVRLLKQWAHDKDGIIPYVFGGCSYKRKIIPQGFSLVSKIRSGEQISYWQRKNLQPQSLSGFDCSSMILCAAQICGIPYFYKNSFTLYHSMEMLKKDEKLKEGDIIWYSGHVMVVSDIQKNLLIEAVGYEAGYGRVHEISIDKVFKQISTYAELVTAYQKETPLERLHSSGRPLKAVYEVKLFALKSLWNNRRR